MNWKTRLRDWWRGYTDFDIECAKHILEVRKGMAGGSMIPITPGQMRALQAMASSQGH